MITNGLVVDGTENVGEFESISEPDKNGMRTIKNLVLDLKYVDIVKQQSTKELDFLLLVEVESENVVITEKEAEGFVYGSFWSTDSEAKFELAHFIPYSKERDLRNAN